MSNLSQIKADSNWGDASNTINTNFQNMDVELEKLKNSTTKFKGYFTSESNLKNKFPSPKRGDIAFVGEPYPGNVYDVLTDGSWHNTTKAPETGNVDLQDYVTLDDFEASLQEQDDKFTESNKKFNELNISALYPTNGEDGTNKYTLSGAIAQVPGEYRSIVGLKITFINSETSKPEEWTYNGGTFTTINNWVQGSSSGDYKPLEWKTDVATTRKSVPYSNRKKGMIISYTHPTLGLISELYTSTNVSDTEIVKDANWIDVATDNYITEYNLSILFPKSGLNGGNTYDFNTAINVVPTDKRKQGFRFCFINANGELETWEFSKNSWSTAGNNFTEVGSRVLTNKKSEGVYVSKIYSSKANSSLVSFLTGVMDMFISSSSIPSEKQLSLFQTNSTDLTYSIIFSIHDKNANANRENIITFNINKNEGIKLLKQYNTNYNLVIQLLVDTDNLPNVAKSNMWSSEYSLNDSCFEDFGGKSLTSIYPFKYNNNLAYVYVTDSIKELYIAKDYDEEIRLSSFIINKGAKTININLYKGSSKLAEITKTDYFEGVQILQFSNNFGYIVVDFNKIPSTFTSPGVLNQSILDDKCFNVIYSPIIKDYLDKIKSSKIYNQNLVYDPTFLNIDNFYKNYFDSLWNPETEKTTVISLNYIPEISANAVMSKRTKSGNYNSVSINISYLKPIIAASQGKYLLFGGLVRQKKATTGSKTKDSIDLRVSGIATGGWQVVLDKDSEEWQFAYAQCLINKCEDLMTIAAVQNVFDVTDYSIENTFGVEVSKFFVAIYDNPTQIPEDINEYTFITGYTDTNKPISAYSIRTKLLNILEYNNRFQFDEVYITQLFNRFMGIVPNWNLPHTTDMGFLSTDIDNMTDGNDDFSKLKAKAPNFYFNSKRRGCMVLFDEDGNPFIIDNKGDKRLLSIT